MTEQVVNDNAEQDSQTIDQIADPVIDDQIIDGQIVDGQNVEKQSDSHFVNININQNDQQIVTEQFVDNEKQITIEHKEKPIMMDTVLFNNDATEITSLLNTQVVEPYDNTSSKLCGYVCTII